MPFTGYSSISYNTKQYLTQTLNELKDKKIIDEWFAIHHDPDTDEKKSHWHVFWLPVSREAKTAKFREYFNQYYNDETNETYKKPLAMQPLIKSVFGHWLLYGIHDEKYLAAKGEVRNFHYNYKDVLYSNEDVYERAKYTIGLRYEDYLVQKTPSARMIEKQFAAGKTAWQIIKDGYAPPSYANSLKRLQDMYNEHIAKLSVETELAPLRDQYLQEWNDEKRSFSSVLDLFLQIDDRTGIKQLTRAIFDKFASDEAHDKEFDLEVQEMFHLKNQDSEEKGETESI